MEVSIPKTCGSCGHKAVTMEHLRIPVGPGYKDIANPIYLSTVDYNNLSSETLERFKAHARELAHFLYEQVPYWYVDVFREELEEIYGAND